tara:strand:- start:307 stop:912 length:606 start_codon:yes stop_codon:yes gene_type:complete
MVTIREWLKKTREQTKQKVKETFEETKDKTKDTYNKVLDTEIDDAQKQVKQATKDTSSFFRHIVVSILACIHQFTRWALLPSAIIVLAFLILVIFDLAQYGFGDAGDDTIMASAIPICVFILFFFLLLFFFRNSYINILPKKFLSKLRNYALVIGTLSSVIILFVVVRNSLCFDLRAGILEDPIYEHSKAFIDFARAICSQ